MSLDLLFAPQTLAKRSDTNEQGKNYPSKYKCVCVRYAFTAK